VKIAVCIAASAAVLVGACATEPHPYKRPLSLEMASMLGDTNVVLVENNSGVQATWFMSDSSATGAQYGLIGALVSATMDAIVNSGPADTAQKLADQVAVVAAVDKMNTDFREQVRTSAALDGHKVRFADVATKQKYFLNPHADDTVEVDVDYRLSEDATTLKVTAVAVYQRPDLKYVTPYTFKSIPEEELSGPVYRNTFVYESSRLVPTITPEIKRAWVDEIKLSYISKLGALPTSKSSAFREMNQKIAEAENDALTKEESSRILVSTWTSNQGEFLFNELKGAHAYLGKYILHDLNNPAVPSLTGKDEIVEQLPDGRTVRIMGEGLLAGSYTSTPGGLTTYGNAAQVAKVNRDRMEAADAALKKK
jgi:hypothetical protein